MRNRLSHAIRVIVPNEFYHCALCEFHGTLEEGIRHAVENQYDERG